MGQAHHLNQDAAYRDVIPTREGMSVNIKGNAFTDIGSPHYEAHKSLEVFWNQYRKGGVKEDLVTTNGDYGDALKASLKSAGYTDKEAINIANKAREQRYEYELFDNKGVPRIPGRINQRR